MASKPVDPKRDTIKNIHGDGSHAAMPDQAMLDAARNVVVVGDERELLAAHIEASAPRWVAGEPEVGELLHARVRYAGALHVCRVERVDADRFALAFEEPLRAPAPGQAVVLYRLDAERGDEVVGGGTVEASGS